MASITLGEAEQGLLKIDVAKLLLTGGFVTASSGQGKSYLLRKLIELIIGKVQTIVLDPEGEFPSLREQFPMLLVGQGGEVALETRTAKLLARKLVELKLSAVIDLYTFDDWNDRRAYVAEFLTGLMNVPKALYHPILIVIDEAHMFAPKQEGAGSAEERRVTAASLKAVNLLSSAGRKRGFRDVLASQRISQIHNMAIADLKNRFIGGITLPNDQIRAADELGLVTKPERVALRDLDPGEFWTYGPALNRKGVTRFKVGQVVTTHPEAGKHALSAPPPTPDAIKALAQALADLPAEAQAERDELAAAQKKVRELEQLINTQHRHVLDLELQATRAQTAVQVPVEKIVEVKVPVFNNGQLGVLKAAQTDLQKALLAFQNVSKAIDEAADVILRPPKPAPKLTTPVRMAGKAEASRINDELRSRPLTPTLSGTGFQMTPALTQALAPGTVKLKLAERRILTVLAQRGPRTKRQVAVQTGYAIKGGGFINAIGALRTAQYIMDHMGLIDITPEGRTALGAYETLPAGQALFDMWLGQVKMAERGILLALKEIYAGDMGYEELAQRAGELVGKPAGYTARGGGFINALGKLRTLELVVNVAPMRVKLSDDLVG